MLGRGDMDGYAVWSWNFLGLWVVVGKGVFGTSDFGRFRTSNTRPEVRSWLQADIQPPEIEVCLYEAFAVKVVLISVACPSLSLVTPLCPGRVLR